MVQNLQSIKVSMETINRASHTGRALSQDKELRCERCGETFDQHCVIDHPCVGFLYNSEKLRKQYPSVPIDGRRDTQNSCGGI